jgi:cysteinyl-tRNA synthetase
MGIDLEVVYEVLRPKTLDDEIQRLAMGVAYDKAKYGVEIQRLVERRSEAKKNRDWAQADALRLTLAQAGVIVTDGPDGSTWELSPDFNLKTLAFAISLDDYQ